MSDLKFASSAAVELAPQNYAILKVDLKRVLMSWRASLLAHEWLDKTGQVKGDDMLSPYRLERRKNVREILASGGVLERPVLGIGMFDNVEIGAGADVLTTLYLDGAQDLEVCVRAGQVGEFEAFLV